MTQKQAAFGKAVLCLFALAALTGCGGGAKTVVTPPVVTAPDWVNKGSGAFKDAGTGSVFYGVGSVTGTKIPEMARTGSEARACAKIAETMNRYVASLTKSYMATTMAGDPSKSSDEQHIEASMKSFAKFTLHGAEITDHFRDNDGTMYALCKLDMNAVKKSLDEAKDLDSKVRDFVRTNAEKAFDELQSEESKH
ncbi:MAG: hypothetical protein HY922_08975 [Elusimicrobia bacterium]|nr:hypothetical protein [Elusimicrobiota bacterium]